VAVLLVVLVAVAIIFQQPDAEVLKDEYTRDFQTAETDAARIEALANLYELGARYQEYTNRLFYEHDPTLREQLQWFMDAPDTMGAQVATVIEGVYVSLDSMENGQDRVLLQAMYDALENRNVAGTEDLMTELQHWRDGRDHAAQGNYEQAIAAYSTAIALNPDHPVTHFDRAEAHIAVEQYADALTDLDETLRVAMEMQVATPTPMPTTGISVTTTVTDTQIVPTTTTTAILTATSNSRTSSTTQPLQTTVAISLRFINTENIAQTVEEQVDTHQTSLAAHWQDSAGDYPHLQEAGIETGEEQVSPPQGILQFSSPDYTVQEGEGEDVIITVNRIGGTQGVVGVEYQTFDQSATGGEDYGKVKGTLIFNPGVSAISLQVPISNDNLAEGNEVAIVRLRNPIGGAVLGTQSEAEMVIIDDDLAPTNSPVRTTSTATAQAQAAATATAEAQAINATATAQADDDLAPTNSPVPSPNSIATTRAQQIATAQARANATAQAQAAATATAEAQAINATATAQAQVVTVPNVVGMDSGSAESTIRGARLVPNTTFGGSNCNPFYVVSQNPASGTTLSPGSSVIIQVCPQVVVPNVIGMDKNAASGALSNVGLDVSVVGSCDGTKPDGQVWATEPGPGSTVSPGITVTVYFYEGCSNEGPPTIISLPVPVPKDPYLTSAEHNYRSSHE
jgi:hypothetical protein